MGEMLSGLVRSAASECSGIDGKILSGACSQCSKGELHGFPKKDVPDWYCFTVSFYCPIKGHHNPRGDACEEYAEGEPRKVMDDVDGF